MSKRTILIFIVSVLSYLSVKAQKDTVVYYMKIYQQSSIIEFERAIAVKDKDSADFSRVILPPDANENKNLFIVRDYYKNGKIKMIGKTSNSNYFFLILQGKTTFFFPNGEKKAEINFRTGIPIGKGNLYFPNGKIYLVGSYSRDKQLIVQECRDSTGKILAKDGNGHCIQYDNDFKYITAEGDIVNELKEGKWHGLLPDSARYECDYNNGILNTGTGYDKNGKQYSFTNIDEDAKFKNGIEGFLNFVNKNVKYPKLARENNVHGEISMSFTIEKDGTLANIKVQRGIGSGCDEEVIRVLKLSPKWVPGTHYGVPVNTNYTLPISFNLANPRLTNYPHRLSPPDSH